MGLFCKRYRISLLLKMYKKKKIIILSALALLPTLSIFSQAGHGVYQFLDLPVSSRMAALGSSNVSLNDGDLNFAFMNPALLSQQTHMDLGLNVASYLADIRFGSAMYGHSFGSKNHCAIGMQYVDYGRFRGFNELNQERESFIAKDFAMSLVYTRTLTEHLSMGASFKPIASIFERYSSFGLAFDAGINYNNPQRQFSAGLVFRNLGRQLKAYHDDGERQHFEALPFNVLFGFSQRFKHAPLRFSFTAHNLQQWDLSYHSTNKANQSLFGGGEVRDEKIGFFDMLFRHMIFGMEFLPGKNFYLAAAYHHRRQQEMSMNGFKSMAGFSFGGGIKLHKFQIGFGMTQFQVKNFSYQFSISTSLGDFRL